MIVPALGVLMLGFAIVGGVLRGFLPGAMACYVVGYLLRKSPVSTRRTVMYGTGLVVYGIAAVLFAALTLFLGADYYAEGMAGHESQVWGTPWESVLMIYFPIHMLASIAVPVVGEFYVARAVQKVKNAAAADVSTE